MLYIPSVLHSLTVLPHDASHRNTRIIYLYLFNLKQLILHQKNSFTALFVLSVLIYHFYRFNTF